VLGAGLVVLVGVTASVVASVSVWWVPAYLALMVLIFVAPWRRHPWTKAAQASSNSTTGHGADLGRGLRVDWPNAGNQNLLASRLDAGPVAGELIESFPAISAPAFSEPTPPRRGRVRARRPASAAAEEQPTSLLVTWKQVGAGRFVRVEGGFSTARPTKPGDTTVAAAPAAEMGTEMLAPAPAALPAQDSPDPLASISGDREIIAASSTDALGSLSEEYGIAPSTFSPVPLVAASIEGQPPEMSGGLASANAVPLSLTNRGFSKSRGRETTERFWSYRSMTTYWKGWVLASADHTLARSDRVRSRRPISPARQTRTIAAATIALNVRRRQAAWCAFGRVAHVERPCRPRSPPDRLCFRPPLVLPRDLFSVGHECLVEKSPLEWNRAA
jgi:hypothetical protein